ncbi:hypothetical protein BCR44DRAFT_77126 [Catenaria anguillulae PL171]|uniref:Uncharacterized protein n=1 Tax=Catenaria anguillulae PL171 TaxID=765915 RepID=A0A1Y2H859_9FUNG|nr:hypothetical protein BCR44DRAFT_77126 [Catenaria anguillulae PL171]
MPNPTIPAWIATAIWTVSFPLCIYPIYHLVHDRRKHTRSSLATSQQLKYAHHERWRTFNIFLWSFIALSHVGLIAYSLLAALESTCYAGRPPDYGLQSHLRMCPKNQLLFALDLANFVVCPMYPIMILATYTDLSLMHHRRAGKWLKRYLFPILGGILTVLTGVVMTANIGIRVHLVTPDRELSGAGLAFQVWARAWANAVYATWFAVLILVALVSTVLIMRLLPMLRQRSESTRVMGRGAGGQARSSERPLGSLLAAGSTGGGNVSSLVKSVSKGMVSGLLNPLTLSISRTSTSVTATEDADTTRSSTTVPAPTATTTSVATNAYTNRLVQCLSHLRLALGLLVLTLLAITAVTIANVLPTVLYVCAGWLSGRIVFLCLFLATREVRHAVLLRRHVPNKRDAGTLALSAWEPGVEGGQESAMSRQSATVGQLGTYDDGYGGDGWEVRSGVEVRVELVSEYRDTVGSESRSSSGQEVNRLRLMSGKGGKNGRKF